jgi:hypothetical protein
LTPIAAYLDDDGTSLVFLYQPTNDVLANHCGHKTSDYHASGGDRKIKQQVKSCKSHNSKRRHCHCHVNINRLVFVWSIYLQGIIQFQISENQKLHCGARAALLTERFMTIQVSGRKYNKHCDTHRVSVTRNEQHDNEQPCELTNNTKTRTR